MGRKVKGKAKRQKKLSGGFVSPSFKWAKKMKSGSEADREFADEIKKRFFSDEKLEAYMQIQKKYDLHPVMSVKIEDEIGVDLSQIETVQERDSHLYIEARDETGSVKGFSIYKDEDLMNDDAVEREEQLLEELEWADTAASLAPYATMGNKDKELVSTDLAAMDIRDRSIGDLRDMAMENDKLRISLHGREGIDKLSKAKLEEKVSDARFWVHHDKLSDSPLVYLVDDLGLHDLTSALDSNLIDIDVRAMAIQEVDNQGAAAILSEGGNQETIHNPKENTDWELVW